MPHSSLLESSELKVFCHFHPELESGFTSFSGPRFLKNSHLPSASLSSAESPQISPLLQSKQEPEGTKAADGGSRLGEHPSAGDPWLPNPQQPLLPPMPHRGMRLVPGPPAPWQGWSIGASRI